MLVLSRRRNERIKIGPEITLTVLEIRGDKVRLGIEAPRGMAVHREEVWLAIGDRSLCACGSEDARPVPAEAATDVETGH